MSMTVYEVTFNQDMRGKTLPSFSNNSASSFWPDGCIREKKDILQNFNPDNSIWITTDIKSRFFILNQLKKNESNINENSVMRARDFWSFLLRKTYPEHHIIDRTVLTFIYHEWAKSKKPEWQRGLKTGNLICQFISQMVHLLQHPLKENLMEEWIKTFSGQNSYVKAWHKLAGDFWSYLEQKKIIESSWASALLLDNLSFDKEVFSPKEQFENIIFDLGFDTHKVESELIHQITSHINTKVLIPFCFDGKHQEDIDYLYDWMNIKKIFSKAQKPPLPINSLKIKKFATPLAEVKDITHQINKALREGVKPDKISVLAPHIEDYWTCLGSYLKKENIPVNKTETVSLISFPVIQLWLAKMWTHLSVLKPEYLQIIRSHQNAYTNFSQLKAEFCNIKELEKWPEWVYTKNRLGKKDELVSYEDFIKWAKNLLPDVSAVIHQPLKECLNDFSKAGFALKALPLKRQAWLSLLEHYLSIKELEIHSGHSKGINCLSFNALGWVESDLIYIAGLSEQNLKNEKQSFLSVLETQSITKDLGFFIKTDPIDKTERMISCFIHQKHKKLILSFSTSDFLGTALNPSCLWLEKAMKYRKENISHFDIPSLSLWDEQQRRPTVKEILYNMDSVQRKLLEQSLQEDTGHKMAEPFFQKRIKSLSPSSLDSYIKCPFIFAAKKMFCLWEGPERNMDIPALEKGSLIHKLFEALRLKLNSLKIISPEGETTRDGDKTSHQKENLLFEQDILQIIEDIKAQKPFKHFLQKVHPLIWEKEKSRLLKKALVFLEQEKQRGFLFKNYRTLACEKEYQCYWSFETESLSAEGDILFSGKIDRIDSDSQSYQIMDYKGSLPTGSIASSWEKQKNFQMAFYIQVLERGLADLPALPVNSALYLSYKNFEYQGMALKNSSYIQLLGSPKKRSLISESQKHTILEKVNEQINTFILKIHAGFFPAKPKVKTICEKCQWRKICRAPHLN